MAETCSAFQSMDLKSQLDCVHTAVFGWPLDAVSPTQDLLNSASLQEAVAKLLRTARVKGVIGETVPQFEKLDRKSQLDIVHTAIFGWPLDHLSPVQMLLERGSLQDATQALLGTERVRFTTRHAVPMWPEDKWVCAEYFGLKIWINLNDSYVGRGVLDGNWENDEVAFVLAQLSPGDAMVDAGANVGVYTLQVARHVGPAGRVYAFEPQADVFAMLSRSVHDNGLDGTVALENCALGDRDGTAAVWRHDGTNPGASIITDRPQPGRGNVTALKRLDSVVFDRPVKLLKMDIEGYEPLLLKGGEDFLRRHRPIILTEWFPRAMAQVAKSSSEEYFQALAALGYTVHLMEGRALGVPMTVETLPLYDQVDEPFNIVCLPQ